MTSKELIKLFKKNGWEHDRTSGSHYVMKKGDKTEVIPFHNKDIKKGLLSAILKRNNLK